MRTGASLYHRLRNSELGWQAVNLLARLRYLRGRIPLTPAEAAVAASLRERGIAVTHLNEFFPSEVFAELRHFAEARWQAVAPRETFAERSRRLGAKTKNLFLVDLWDSSTIFGEAGPHALDLAHPFIRFSVSAPVLGVVSRYLGMLPKFREFFLQATIPVPAGEAPYASQRWHADPDDRKLVKTFLYVNDVDESAGPFTYIEGTHRGGRRRHLFPFDPERGRHPDPAFVARVIPPSDILRCTGRAGTIIFCDTSGIHRGGYATSKPRIMYTSVYTTRASARATRFTRPPGFQPEAIASPVVRYAVTP